MSQENIDRMRQASRTEPAWQLLGIELEEIADGYSRVSLKTQPEFSNFIGWHRGEYRPAGAHPGYFGEALFEGFAGLISTVFQSLGTITFIFAIIQWAQPQINAKSKPWDPRQMKDTYPTDQVRPAEQIVQIV